MWRNPKHKKRDWKPRTYNGTSKDYLIAGAILDLGKPINKDYERAAQMVADLWGEII
jgi:hypothetical protein